MKQFLVEFGAADRPPEADGRLDAPAFHRNHQAIWLVVAPFLDGKTGDVLEVGSGTGQHVIEFARKAPGIVWWPSDCHPRHLESIAAWRRHSMLANVRPPLPLDVSEPGWDPGRHECVASDFLAIVCANVLHIAPWRVAQGLFCGAARHLRQDGRMFVYGPFMRNGKHTAPSNAAFDASLRSSNPEWGVRDLEDVRSLADGVALRIADIVEMPANNLILICDRKR